MAKATPKATDDDIAKFAGLSEEFVHEAHDLQRRIVEKGFDGVPNLDHVRDILQFGTALCSIAGSLLYAHKIGVERESFERLKAERGLK